MGRVIIGKMSVLLQIDHGVSIIPIKVSANFCKNRVILKFIWKGKGHRIAETTLKNKNKMRIITHRAKTYYLTIVIKALWYWGWVDS